MSCQSYTQCCILKHQEWDCAIYMNIPKKAAKIPEKQSNLPLKDVFISTIYRTQIQIVKRLQRTQGHVHTHNGKILTLEKL